MQMEVNDEHLFARITRLDDMAGKPDSGNPKGRSQESDKEDAQNAVLLVAATELAYETVATSALNAEELRREQGIHILQVGQVWIPHASYFFLRFCTFPKIELKFSA